MIGTENCKSSVNIKVNRIFEFLREFTTDGQRRMMAVVQLRKRVIKETMEDAAR